MEKEIGEFVNPDENLPRFGICRRIEYRYHIYQNFERCVKKH